MESRMYLSPVTMRLFARWYSRVEMARVPIVRDSFLGWVFGLLGQRAVTIDGTIHLTRHAPDDLDSAVGMALIGHELFHVAQQQEMGSVGFLVRYLVNWRPWHIRDGGSHPMEAPAYAREEEIRKALED